MKATDQTYAAVVVECLFDHVELPVLSGVVSYTGAVKPVSIVAADIVINLRKKKKLNEHLKKSTHKYT